MIRSWLVAVLALATSLIAAIPTHADDFRPAYLQITQIDATSYDVLWKVPALGEDAVLKIRPQFPPGSVTLTQPRTRYADGVAVQRWRISIAGGLEGKEIAFPGLAETRIDVLARLVRADGSVQLERILPGSSSILVKASPGAFEVVQTYTMLGIEHILTGFDHLCFVLVLVMIVGGNRQLVWTVTAFTVAHSITLALATLDVIHVPRPPVEAIIALSIVFVASEIVEKQRGHEGLTSKQPWLVAFLFGLLHGLGFAGALAEIGLPANAVPLALFFFNIGVELGQLFFIAAVLIVTFFLLRLVADRSRLDRLAVIPVYLIGGVASYWVLERLSGLWE